MEWFENMSRGTKITLLVVVGLVLFGCCLALVGYNFVNDTRNTGIALEKQLNAQYLDNQNELSAYISGFYESLGLANLKSDKMDQILTDAVKGRYDKEGFGSNSGFFYAISEAYPDLAGLDIYDKIVDYIVAGREAYKAKQTKLLDILRSYDTWRETGLVRSALVRMLGFPSQGLEARVGEMTFTGEQARNKMYQIVLTGDALKAYETGTMEPLKVQPQ